MRMLHYISRNKIIIIILISVFLKSIAWLVLFPPFQTPDEPTHFANVQYIAENNKMPIATDGPGSLSGDNWKIAEAAKPNFEGGPKFKSFKEIWNELISVKSTPEDRELTGNTAAAGYPYGYYGIAAIVYKLFYFSPAIVRFYAIRLLSVLIGLVSVFFAYRIGQKLDSKWLGVSLALLIGFNPMYSMVSIAINNDILMNTMAIICLYWLLSMIQNQSKRNCIIGGVLLGVSLLVKAQMLFVVAFCIFGLLLIWKRNKTKLKDSAKQLFVIGISMILVYLPFAIFSWIHYRTFFGAMGMQTKYEGNPTLMGYLDSHLTSLHGLEMSYHIIIRLFWGCFGLLDIKFHDFWTYKILTLITFISVIGVIYGLIKRKKNSKIALFCLLFYIANYLFLLMVEYQYYMEYYAFMLQGRYLFTALLPLSIIMLLGTGNFFSERYKKHVFSVFMIGIVSFNVASYWLVFSNYYI